MSENNNNSTPVTECQCDECIQKRLDKKIDKEHHERVAYKKKHLQCCGNCVMINKMTVCELYNKTVCASYVCKNWSQDNLSQSERKRYNMKERESQ